MSLDEALQDLQANTAAYVHIDDTNIGAAAATALAGALLTNTALTMLSLGHNEIGAAGATALAGALATNTSLTGLYLWRNNIAFTRLTVLTKVLEINSTLTALDLSRNPAISDADLARVSALLAQNKNPAIVARKLAAHPAAVLSRVLVAQCAAARRRLSLPPELWHSIERDHARCLIILGLIPRGSRE